MSLRRRLTLSLLTILALLAVNVATHFWGSFARNQSMIAYRNSVNAAQLSSEIEQLLDNQRQQILVLAALRDTTEDPLESNELEQAEKAITAITANVRELGELSHDVTRVFYQNLWQSSNLLLDDWLSFYRNYNDPDYEEDTDDPAPYLLASEHLKELEQQQASIAVQRASAIDRTIALTDRITIIGFISSILLTAILGFFLVRYTNSSLKSLMRGTERFGSGDLNYRIDNISDSGELGDLARAFNDMSGKLHNAIYDVRKAKDVADEANAAKSSFLANVSHELRTPLNAIIGYSEMLHDELGDEQEIDRPQFQSDLEKIITSGRQLLSLIDEILDLSKIETGKMTIYREEFHPGELLQQVCESLTPLFQKKNNRLLLADMRTLPLIETDANKFRQIFVNLLSNASKFTDGGDISVAGTVSESQEGWLEFSVTDTGIGMDEAQQARVFDAFIQAEETTSANYGGTGLGLTICREFCDLMGGAIRVESTVGAGSTFYIKLPATAPESTPADA